MFFLHHIPLWPLWSLFSMGAKVFSVLGSVMYSGCAFAQCVVHNHMAVCHGSHAAHLVGDQQDCRIPAKAFEDCIESVLRH